MLFTLRAYRSHVLAGIAPPLIFVDIDGVLIPLRAKVQRPPPSEQHHRRRCRRFRQPAAGAPWTHSSRQASRPCWTPCSRRRRCFVGVAESSTTTIRAHSKRQQCCAELPPTKVIW